MFYLHIALHFAVPAIAALLFFKKNRQRAYLVMVATMLVDIDHLLADPVCDPGRCSIGFHPLHGLVPIILYLSLCFHPKTRYIGLGLMIHMALDSIDCQMTNGVWFSGNLLSL